MNDNVQGISTQQDDVSTTGQTEDALLAAVMANSPIMDEVAPLPEEEMSELDPEESDEEVEDPEESEEAVSEDEEEEVEEEAEEAEGEDAGEEPATQETDVFSQDDLDLEARVVVKIDGEEQEVSFGDLIKGYSTEQHLSKQGRELGEARKALEQERVEKLGELETATATATQMLGGAEQNLAKQYHDLEAQIEKARQNGDTYEMSELKDKREQAQKRYWEVRNRRESLVQNFAKQKEEAETQKWNEQIEVFHSEIPDLIPDFNEDVAQQIRDFAISEGVDESLIDSVIDPRVVKFIDDYRRLKQNVSKGSAKRKAVPAKKAVPQKKAAPTSKKKKDAAQMRKARAFREDATQDDQMAFLRDYASNSLNNL